MGSQIIKFDESIIKISLPFTTAWMELGSIMPGGERQILQDLTYEWNLINKTNEQNRTRDMEIKNKLTVTRGEVERE